MFRSIISYSHHTISIISYVKSYIIYLIASSIESYHIMYQVILYHISISVISIVVNCISTNVYSQTDSNAHCCIAFVNRPRRGGSRIFQRWVTFVKGGGGGVTIHCLINKICELEACFLNFSYVLAKKGGVTRHPFHPLDPLLHGRFYIKTMRILAIASCE